jgi:hypothetical protein
MTSGGARPEESIPSSDLRGRRLDVGLDVVLRILSGRLSAVCAVVPCGCSGAGTPFQQ